nr:hypothetical protein [Tanacetum cinerariifolium]
MIEEINQDAKVTLVTPTQTYTRRRAVSTSSGRVSTTSRMISTSEESVSTIGESMPVSTAGMIDKGKGIMEESESDVIKTKRQQEQERLGHEAAEIIKARVKADEELTQRLQAEERDKYSEVDQAKMLEIYTVDTRKYKKIIRVGNHIEKGMDIYMPVEKEYTLSRGILTQMLCVKLIVEEDSKMCRELIRKIFMQVIVIGDLVASVRSASSEGPIPPKTSKQKIARKNELKEKSTLMLAILDEHLLKFHAYKDAKSLWELLRSLPLAWNNIALIMRSKSDLDTLSMDDLYNNLKVYESEIKSQSSSSSNSHNVAFVSSDNTGSTNETVNTTHGVFAANLKQIDTDDLEKMDLKWQVEMLTMRVKRFIKKTGWKLDLNGKDTIGFDRTKVECYNCHRRGHFARECRAPMNQGNRNRDAPTRNTPVDTSTINALVVQDGIDSQISALDKTSLGYDGHVNKSEVLNNVVDNCEVMGMIIKLDNSVFKPKISENITRVPKTETNASKTSKDSLKKLKTIRPSALIIEDWESNSKDENVFEPKKVKKTVKPSLENIEFVNARNITVENENKAENLGSSVRVLGPLSLSFNFVFMFEIFKSLSFSRDRLCHLAILCLDQHAHTLHHLESLLTISIDILDILKKDLVYQSLRKSLSLILELS